MAISVTPKYDGEPFEKMLKRFKNKVRSEDLMNEIKKFEYYEKPSSKKHRKAKEPKR